MHRTFTYPEFPYRRPPEWGAQPGAVHRHPVVVVGAGPVGMVAALDLRAQGVPVVLLDDDHTVSVGSRGLCYAKRTLEILDRLGVGEAVVDRGVTWNVGRTFRGEEEVFRFNLLPEPDHRRPGMVNLQQYHLEHFLVQACERAGVDLRWRNRVVAVDLQDAGVGLEVETPEGRYRLHADWLVACDGARSPIRRQLGLDMAGQVFKDRFLIADVVMQAPFPAERWFWFDPPFHPRQSVLLHREADDVWRIDFQLGWDADPEEEKKPERVIPRIQAMLGPQHRFELEWVSVYTFQCRRMERFDHGRVLFAGDAAHQVSPFGARGANSGIQDADNLAWKLGLVLRGLAPPSLMASYSQERGVAADENLLNSTRSTDFITPKSPVSRGFRDAVLELAQHHPFARALVNSGRLSVPTHVSDSPLNTPWVLGSARSRLQPRTWMRPGAPLDDAPVQQLHASGAESWLLQHLGGRFQVLVVVQEGKPWPSDFGAAALARLRQGPVPLELVLMCLPSEDAGALGEVQAAAAPAPGDVAPIDTAPMDTALFATMLRALRGRFAQRYAAEHGQVLLVRPDQHLAARWEHLDVDAVLQARDRALGLAAPVEAGAPAEAPPYEADPLRLHPHFHHPAAPALRAYSPGDDFYQSLIDAHRDLDEAGSAALNARLVLLLANHIGSVPVLEEALRLARPDVAAPQTRPI